ncbi:MAG: DUF3817 domain-containing protein [Sphingobacterium composti]
MLRILRLIALWEAISAVLLFFVAMPIKYYFYQHIGLTKELAAGFSYMVGLFHGALFVILALMLIAAWRIYKWTFLRLVKYLIISVIPIASFWIEIDLKKDINAGIK